MRVRESPSFKSDTNEIGKQKQRVYTVEEKTSLVKLNNGT